MSVDIKDHNCPVCGYRTANLKKCKSCCDKEDIENNKLPLSTHKFIYHEPKRDTYHKIYSSANQQCGGGHRVMKGSQSD